jgi:hypothetical protein
MRKRLMWTLALGAALAVVVAGVASAFTPVVVKAGNLIFTINGGVKPTALPKKTLAPITLQVEGGIAAANGTHPPALKEAIVDTDKNGGINPKGLPTCTAGKLQARETKAAEKACKPALIGSGTTDVQVEFAEQAPFTAHSKLLAFNGGTKGGVTTIYIHAFLTSPVSTAIVTTVKIKKEHRGRYGLRSVASVPVIAGGSGSVTHFKLTLHRLFKYKGRTQSYFVAKCADGHFNAEAEAVFRNGETIKGSIVRTCKSK